MTSKTSAKTLPFLALVALLSVGCGDHLKIVIDGSSTVQPISEAVMEEFRKIEPEIQVSVGTSGTGGGFKKFVKGETAINDASRPIKSGEAERAKEAGIGFIELPVAFDGISVVVNPKNSFVDYLTVAELKKIWEPDSAVTNWSDIRAGWPDTEVELFGPGADSGTFDYFTKAINGEEGACRKNFTASENDNILVTGVAGQESALGFFGFAYYDENRDKLRIVPIQSGDGPAVTPSHATINDGSYKPLSRPIFIYVSTIAAAEEHVKKFVSFYLESAPKLVPDAGYVALPDAVYALAKERFEKGVTGSLFPKKSDEGLTLEQAMRATQE